MQIFYGVERLPAKISLKSELWFQLTGKSSKTPTNNMPNVGYN